MQKLKVEKRDSSNQAEVDRAYIAEVEPFNIPNSCLLPLTNPFAFNFSFLILPNIISNNIPIFFL